MAGMDSLQKILARMARQLRGLSLSQRLALLLGGVLVAVSVVGLIRWAASPEMVPLLDQDLDPAELAQVRSGLELMNEPFRLADRKILVSATANRPVILAHLQQQDKLPADTSIGFDALVKEANPWISQAEHERRWTVALKHELEQVLRQFEGVKSASVFLPMTAQRRGFGGSEPAASASVTLSMQGGQPVARELALAVARLVVGAVRGLPLQNVEVLDSNGVSALDWDGEAAGVTSLDRQRRRHEQDIRAKIVNQLPDARARVGVQVELDLTQQNTETETPKGTVEVSTENTSEETVRARDSGQPGVQPNVGVAAGGRATGESTVRRTDKSEFKAGMTREVKATPPGSVKATWAAVNISHSYLESCFRRANPGAAAPTDQQIEQQFQREKPRILSQVTKLVKPQDEAHVAVDWYYDTVAELEPESRAALLDDAFQLARRWGPQSGLAVLALLSLGLMLRMARRSSAAEAFGLEIGLPKEAIAAAQQAARDIMGAAEQRATSGRSLVPASPVGYEGVLEVGSASIGQAAVTEGILVAQEVDEKTVQTHKMLEQVSQVVDGDPDGASALLEQWIDRTDSFGN